MRVFVLSILLNALLLQFDDRRQPLPGSSQQTSDISAVKPVQTASDVMQASIRVDAEKVIHTVDPRILGCNIEDLNYQCYGGVYSQLLHGESFEEHIDPCDILKLSGQASLAIFVMEDDRGRPQLWAFDGRRWNHRLARKILGIAGRSDEPVTADDLPMDKRKVLLDAAMGDRQVSRQWRAVINGSAMGSFKFEREQTFSGTQSQLITFISGAGEVGIDNAGLNRWGINLVEGRPYEGLMRIRAEKTCTIYVSLRDSDGDMLVEQAIRLDGNTDIYQRVTFTLKPGRGDAHGRFAVTLKEPGTIVLGYAFLQPGDWGRFRGLPLRRELVQAVIDQGVKVMRYNGAMVNRCRDGHLYKWKQMIGPRDNRIPYQGWFNPYASHGFAIFEFLDMCKVAGFLAIPGIRIDETAEDMADFVEYAIGSTDSTWGGRRAVGGHASAYDLTHVQIGNEERLDERYAERFIKLGRAVWSKDPTITLVVSNNLSNHGADWRVGPDGRISEQLRLASKIVQFGADCGGKIWWDCHYLGRTLRDPDDPNGRIACMRNLRASIAKLVPGYTGFRLAPLEENGTSCDMMRALVHARNINEFIRIGNLPAVAVANTFQADGQSLVWNQGRIFFNSSRVWFQPPYYVDRMIYHSWADKLVATDFVSPGDVLDVVARISSDGRTLILQVVNIEPAPVESKISIVGFNLSQTPARVIQLSGELGDVNTAEEPTRIVPTEMVWKHSTVKSEAIFTFPRYSFTIIRLEAK